MSQAELAYFNKIVNSPLAGDKRPICKRAAGSKRCGFTGTTEGSCQMGELCRANDNAAWQNNCTAFILDVASLRKWMKQDEQSDKEVE